MNRILSVATLKAASATSALAAAIALGAAGVRLAPWVFSPQVPTRVVVPFGRSLLWLALEAALVVGYPVGATLACEGFVARGEGRVLLLLGEAPLQTMGRLVPIGFVFVALIGLVSALAGTDASYPGAVVNELIAEGERACAQSATPKSYPLPPLGVAWLCTPGSSPRVYGRAPGLASSPTFTATRMIFGPDLRSVTLEDATLLFADASSTTYGRIRKVTLRGLGLGAAASNLAPGWRAAITMASTVVTAGGAVASVLFRLVHSPAGAVLVAASGSLSGLGVMRALEREGAPAWLYFAPPIAAAIGMTAIVAVFRGLILAPSARDC